MVLHRIRALVGTGALLLVCGSATAMPATAAAHRPHHPRHHHTGGIPQHNAGDHDVDNNGGPSDGDGEV
jgi:hypothetical protein